MFIKYVYERQKSRMIPKFLAKTTGKIFYLLKIRKSVKRSRSGWQVKTC